MVCSIKFNSVLIITIFASRICLNYTNWSHYNQKRNAMKRFSNKVKSKFCITAFAFFIREGFIEIRNKLKDLSIKDKARKLTFLELCSCVALVSIVPPYLTIKYFQNEPSPDRWLEHLGNANYWKVRACGEYLNDVQRLILWWLLMTIL